MLLSPVYASALCLLRPFFLLCLLLASSFLLLSASVLLSPISFSLVLASSFFLTVLTPFFLLVYIFLTFITSWLYLPFLSPYFFLAYIFIPLIFTNLLTFLFHSFFCNLSPCCMDGITSLSCTLPQSYPSLLPSSPPLPSSLSSPPPADTSCLVRQFLKVNFKPCNC